MKISQIVPSLEARHGGPSRTVRGLSSALAALGNEVHLLSTAEHPDPRETSTASGSLGTRIFPRQFPRKICASRPLGRFALQTPAEIVHHHGVWLRTLHYARLAAHKHRAPLVVSPRGMLSAWALRHHGLRKRVAATLVHPGAFNAVAGWHVTSEEEAADIARLGSTAPVCVAPNGVDLPAESAEHAAASSWRDAVPDLAGRRVALFYSRFHSKKRVLELIDLWLSTPRDSWVLLLVGIPEEYSVARLQEHVSRRGGNGLVYVRDGTDAPPPYALASLFLLPSHSENFGLVVAEALIRGVPVLSSDGAPWRGLDLHDAGRCVPWNDFPRALDGLLAESAERLADRGARGARWAREAFAWTATARTLFAFYEQLRASRRA